LSISHLREARSFQSYTLAIEEDRSLQVTNQPGPGTHNLLGA
jgi:hypothetical protein